jgi:hypothetical protein
MPLKKQAAPLANKILKLLVTYPFFEPTCAPQSKAQEELQQALREAGCADEFDPNHEELMHIVSQNKERASSFLSFLIGHLFKPRRKGQLWTCTQEQVLALRKILNAQQMLSRELIVTLLVDDFIDKHWQLLSLKKIHGNADREQKYGMLKQLGLSKDAFENQMRPAIEKQCNLKLFGEAEEAQVLTNRILPYEKPRGSPSYKIGLVYFNCPFSIASESEGGGGSMG